MASELCFKPAVELARMIRDREVSATEAMSAFIERINEVNPKVNAMLAWNTLTVEGPMARSVQDVAFLLSVLAGPDSRVPISITEPGSIFSEPLARDFKDTRIAWSRNLGRYPVEPVVNQVCDSARQKFLDLGCTIEDAQPDVKEAGEIFQTLRAWQMAETRREDYREHRNLMKDTVIWNIEQGFELSGEDVSTAEVKRAALGNES